MGLRFFKPTKASLHETLSTRAAHDIAVRGPVRRLFETCKELRTASTSDGGEPLLPYWLVAALALPLLGPNPDVRPEEWAIHLWEYFASPEALGKPLEAILESDVFDDSRDYSLAGLGIALQLARAHLVHAAKGDKQLLAPFLLSPCELLRAGQRLPLESFADADARVEAGEVVSLPGGTELGSAILWNACSAGERTYRTLDNFLCPLL